MAAENGRSDPDLTARLFAEPFRYDFFEAVRFHAHSSLSFPPSAIQDLEPSLGDGDPARMMTAFMGLTGPLGVLPRHYTELIIDRGRRHDNALRDFFDLFNHRLISLFHRAWEKYRFHVEFERTAKSGGGYDPFSLHLFDFIGMGTDNKGNRIAFGNPTTDNSFMQGEYFTGRTAHKGTFTHL